MDEQIVFRPLPDFKARANINASEVAKAKELAEGDLAAYWEEAADRLDWFRKWDHVLTGTGPEDWAWFTGAKCNIIYNALDRHIETANKNKLALIWEGEPGDSRKYTYYELYREVSRCAEAMRSLGIGKRDRVVVYMPALPETLIAMLAAAKIGAVHCLVFAGYSAKVLRERVAEIKAKAVITCDGFYRNGHVVRVKDVVDKALMDTSTECVDSVVVVHRANMEVSMSEPRDMWFEDLVRRAGTESVTEVMDANDPLCILHTSGSTGKPKTVIHSHGGYMVGVHRTFDWVFDIKPTDIYWCTAELSWITGHSYVAYGPLMAGTTTVMFEGHPLYPKADRLWRIVAKYGVNILYTSPTMIRMLKRYGSQYPKQHDLSTLRLLASVGEPISPKTWMWYYDVVGSRRCPVLDTWWQTETGMIMISPLPVSALKPGSVAKPLPGVEADVVDEKGNPLGPGEKGFLTINTPWPSMCAHTAGRAGLKSWNKVPGVYFSGDAAFKDEDGYFWVQGRADEVINVAGHRLGTAEIESAANSHKAVAESAAVGVPDKIKGQAVKLFIVPNPDFSPSEDLSQELIDHVATELGPVAVVKSVQFMDDLPKTATGKILRGKLSESSLTEVSDSFWS